VTAGVAASQLNSNAVVASASVLVASGQGAVMVMVMDGAVSTGADGAGRLSFSDAASSYLQVSGGGTWMTNSVGSSQVLLLHVTPPEGTEP
jgi:hypothetical protein